MDYTDIALTIINDKFKSANVFANFTGKDVIVTSDGKWMWCFDSKSMKLDGNFVVYDDKSKRAWRRRDHDGSDGYLIYPGHRDEFYNDIVAADIPGGGTAMVVCADDPTAAVALIGPDGNVWVRWNNTDKEI